MIKKDIPVTVVHIITRLILGGAQENTILTVEGLKRDPGYRVVLVSGPALGPEGELVRRVNDSGVELIIIPELRRNVNPLFEIIAFIKLFILMLRFKPTIVHTHSAKAGILGRFAAYLAGVKIIIHTLHGLSFHSYQGKWINALSVTIERMASWVTTRFISVADAMTAQSLKAGIGRPEKYVTIYSALELSKFIPKKADIEIKRSLGLADNKVVGTIARLFPLKGHEYIIRIAARIIRDVPEVKFLFVGDGSVFGQLKNEVRGRGLEEWFLFTGLVSPDRIPEMIQAIDILVHPSLREGLPRTIPQSFSLSKPVVAFNVDGTRELVIEGQTGFLISPPNSVENSKEAVDLMAEAIINLLRKTNQARQMGKAGRKFIIPNFDADYMVSRIIGQYADLIGKYRCGK